MGAQNNKPTSIFVILYLREFQNMEEHFNLRRKMGETAQ
jgi:hypothetical protein